MDMLDLMSRENQKTHTPLAERMKPQKLADFYGQDKFVKKGSIFYDMIANDKLMSMIFYGPSGVGKTSLAKIISLETGAVFIKINAVTSGIADIRNAVEKARLELSYGNRTVLFIDEIHRFNKKQQDALLPYVESGLITLIGATTENPYFEVNSALNSRLHIIPLKSLESNHIKSIINSALKKDDIISRLNLKIEEEALDALAELSSGDARKALNTLELVISVLKDKSTITMEDVTSTCFEGHIRYDKKGDMHYDVISAFIKSIRGSDPDAAIHYLARMITAGEDPNFIARRLVISAAEDIGNADPMALVIANSAAEAARFVGFPEARIILAQATTYLATAPKSNRAYLAINEAIADIENGGDFAIPLHLRDWSYKDSYKLKDGAVYKYPHDYKWGYVKQEYMPKNLKNKVYYKPTERGREKYIKQYLDAVNGNSDK